MTKTDALEQNQCHLCHMHVSFIQERMETVSITRSQYDFGWCEYGRNQRFLLLDLSIARQPSLTQKNGFHYRNQRPRFSMGLKDGSCVTKKP